jgi:hypothetical protein
MPKKKEGKKKKIEVEEGDSIEIVVKKKPSWEDESSRWRTLLG